MDNFSMKIPSELKLKFKLIAVKQGRDMADIIRKLIKDFVNENKKSI